MVLIERDSARRFACNEVDSKPAHANPAYAAPRIASLIFRLCHPPPYPLCYPPSANRDGPLSEFPEIATPIPNHGEIRKGGNFAIDGRRSWKTKMREHLDENNFVCGRRRVSD